VKFTIFVLLAVAGVSLAQRNPNPCNVDPPLDFVNDYTSCAAYFWCNEQGEAIPTGPCDADFQFDEEEQACIFSPDPCDVCPETGFLAVSEFKRVNWKKT
jgi:hypothetical protein